MNIKPFPNKKIVDLKSLLVKRGDHVTHGDLIIVRCDEKDLPANFDSLENCPNGVLALGEFTGHAHKIELDDVSYVPTQKTKLTQVNGEKQKSLNERVVCKMVSPSEMYMRVTEPVLLKHQEHNFFRIHPGSYEIGIQVERNPYDDQIRSLRD